METTTRYEAGVIDGQRHVWWSRHSTQALAERAARAYARKNRPRTGGVGAWSGFVRTPNGEIVEVRA